MSALVKKRLHTSGVSVQGSPPSLNYLHYRAPDIPACVTRAKIALMIILSCPYILQEPATKTHLPAWHNESSLKVTRVIFAVWPLLSLQRVLFVPDPCLTAPGNALLRLRPPTPLILQAPTPVISSRKPVISGGLSMPRSNHILYALLITVYISHFSASPTGVRSTEYIVWFTSNHTLIDRYQILIPVSMYTLRIPPGGARGFCLMSFWSLT